MMIDRFDRIPDAYRSIVDHLECGGHKAYFVGGCVRDLLLGREPKDFDITTSATPQDVAKLFHYLGADVDLVGAHFGVSLVKWHGVVAEVATFRTDGAYSDGRRPDQVKYTKYVDDDLARRDFTINALLMTQHGKVLDYVGGLHDLHDKIVAAVGNPHGRITEDPVRMLRAIKFASRYDFMLDPMLSVAIRQNSTRLMRVAAERVAKELASILVEGRAALGIRMLEKHGLLPFIALELDHLRSTPQNPKYHPEGDVMTHTLGLLKQLPKGCPLTLALATLLHDIGKPATLAIDEDGQPTFHDHEHIGADIAKRILTNLKFSNDVIETTVQLVDQHMRFRVIGEMRKSKQLRFVRQENFAELLSLHYMDATAGSGNLANYSYALDLFHNTPPEVSRPERLVTGDDLIANGLKPGPHFKALLTAIEDAQLEGTVKTKADALAMITDYIGGGFNG